MQLHLERPLVFLDFEATGVDPLKDRIIEMAFIKYMPDGTIIHKPEKNMPRLLVNPQMSIPEQSILVHGITDEDVKNQPTFEQLSKNIYKFLFDCDFAGFNSNKFDLPLLVEEFMRVGMEFDIRNHRLIDAQTIFHLMEERTLQAAYQFYCGQKLTHAHQAMSDVEATAQVFFAQLEKYKNVVITDKKGETSFPIQADLEVLHHTCRRQNTVDFFGRLVENEKGEVCFNFGKYKGELVAVVFAKDPFYYDWMMKGEFPLFTKKIIKEIKESLKKNKNESTRKT